MLTLTATPRTLTGKSAAKALLQEGLIPAVVYGPKQEALSISLPLADFKRILRTGGESSVLELSGVGEGKMQVLIQEVDVDPVTSIPRHADLLALVKGAKVNRLYWGEVMLTPIHTESSPYAAHHPFDRPIRCR